MNGGSRGRTARPAPARPSGPAPSPGPVLVWEGEICHVVTAGPVPGGARPAGSMAPDAWREWQGWQGMIERIPELPQGWAAAGLAGLVDRQATWAAGQKCGHVTLILDRPALVALGLPVPAGRDDAPPDAGFGELDQVADLRAQGWDRVWTARGWINARRVEASGRHIAVTIGLAPWLVREQRYLLINLREPGATAAALWHWGRLVGTAWTSTPGSVGTDVVANTVPGGLLRIWRPRPTEAGQTAAWGHAHEPVLTATAWRRPVPAGQVARAFDARRAYLATWTTVRLARARLRPEGPIPFDPKMSGWWLVDLAPWVDQRMPDPTGRLGDAEVIDAEGTRRAWVTTPTLELLTQLTTAGAYGGFAVRDAYVAPGEPLLKPAAEALDRTWHLAEAERVSNRCGLADVALRIGDAVKSVYSSAHSQWDSAVTRLPRPDFTAAVIAQGRVTTWRKAWRVGNECGRWPVAIATDAIYYACDPADDSSPYSGAGGIVIGDRLGQFKVKEAIAAERWNDAQDV